MCEDALNQVFEVPCLAGEDVSEQAEGVVESLRRTKVVRQSSDATTGLSHAEAPGTLNRPER